MTRAIRFWVLFALFAAASSAHADYDGPDGYGSSSTYELDVSHDGYAREGQPSSTFDSSTYVVIEEEDGEPEQIDGETVIVVQEPEPIAATAEAPPAPRTVVVEESTALCPGGIWVDGYWGYSNGDYIWVDGHCVVERVNYVFVQPRWDFYSNVWWFVPGYYRPCGVYVGFGYYRPWYWYPPYYHSYYPARRPVPVYRSVARRPTSTRVTPASRPPTRRTGVTPGRTSTVTRAPSTRTSTVTRAPSTRTSTVTRAPNGRAATVSRSQPSAARVQGGARPSSNPTLTSTVPRSRPDATIVREPRANPSRTGVATRGSSTAAPSSTRTVTRSGNSAARTRSVGRPSSNGSARGRTVGRTGGGVWNGSAGGRSSAGGSRSSFGRGGSFGGPSSRGFGGARSASTARGR